jgi:hypothetical protein
MCQHDGGVCLNDEEKGLNGLLGMVRAATNARNRADAVLGLRRTAEECYRSRQSLVIWNVGLNAQASHALEVGSYWQPPSLWSMTHPQSLATQVLPANVFSAGLNFDRCHWQG